MGMSGPGVDSTQRTNVDDSAVAGAQMVDCFAGYQKRAAGVGFKDSVPLFEAELFKGGGIEDSSVVDEEVEPSELGGDGGDCLARGGLRADIAFDRHGAVSESFNLASCESCLLMGGAVSDGDVGSRFGESQGDCASDALGAPGDQCRFAVERLGWHSWQNSVGKGPGRGSRLQGLTAGPPGAESNLAAADLGWVGCPAGWVWRERRPLRRNSRCRVLCKWSTARPAASCGFPWSENPCRL